MANEATPQSDSSICDIYIFLYLLDIDTPHIFLFFRILSLLIFFRVFIPILSVSILICQI